jgi:hypothetical protein
MCLLAVSFVSAVSMDDACSSRGFASTTSLWTYNETFTNVYGDVSIVGNARKFNWTSDSYIDGVVYKSGSRTYLSDGGFNGTIPKTVLSNDVVFVAFCSNNTVPEFGLIAGMLAVIGAIGVFMYKKR